MDICAGKEGPCSDINIWRERKHLFATEQEFAGDKAYVGESQINTPHKKPKKMPISWPQNQVTGPGPTRPEPFPNSLPSSSNSK